MIPDTANGIFNKKLRVLSVNYDPKFAWLKFTSRASHLVESHLLGTPFSSCKLKKWCGWRYPDPDLQLRVFQCPAQPTPKAQSLRLKL